MEATANKELVKGGEFLIKETSADQIFIPEDFTEEQRMMAQTCEDFIEKEIVPRLEEIDAAKDPAFMSSMLDKAGELGLLATGVPTEYEGFGMDFNSSMLVTDYTGHGHSFVVALSAHTGIGTLPIQYYGNEAQKAKYLPKLATGEWKACYCLTEPDSGSDANSGKTKAVLSEDGKHYIINGQKMWITNGGFADIFIVFAKIDDDKKLTAFIIEKDFGGITMNAPEAKMGIKGSDTRQVFFNDCKVPVENMLSTRENGFKIAVNILNIGRIKLCASTHGGAREALNHSIKYANERKQFGTAIANFGAIKHKLGQQAVRLYATESAMYRAGQNIDDSIAAMIVNGVEESEAKLKSFEQFAIECALLKVFGSETLDYVVDETVQVFGGMGYSADAPADRCYRDSRINRIFEGTNEINRILSIGTIIKRSMKGELDVMSAAMEVQKELMSGARPELPAQGTDFAYEKALVQHYKKALLITAGAAVQALGTAFNDEQEVMIHLADMLMNIYAAESALLRTEKLVARKGADACQTQLDLMHVFLHDTADSILLSGKQAISAFAEGDMYKNLLGALKGFTRTEAYNTKAARRRVADTMISKGKYTLD
ncbi:acyl-CoA dehydrogenase [marine bacterium AO1-C]|nr:acyl-CoA dehydrogenase [marine bacterium AO1-C]